jgi:hypothetical protein
MYSGITGMIFLALSQYLFALNVGGNHAPGVYHPQQVGEGNEHLVWHGCVPHDALEVFGSERVSSVCDVKL